MKPILKATWDDVRTLIVQHIEKTRVKRYCPQCRYHWSWKLNDGRFKCRRCGHRYTFRSVWEANRLSDRIKRSLLSDFIQGGTSAINASSRYARDRFLRLARMTIALHEQYCEPFTGSMVPVPNDVSTNRNNHGIGLMVLGIRQMQDQIRVFPVFGPDAQHLVELLHQTSRTDGLYYTAARYAYGTVSVQDNMIVAHTTQESDASREGMIESFWDEVSRWLAHYQRIPVEWFHLFIGEISFRFHHRDQDLLQLMLTRVRQTPTHELKDM